MRGKKKRGGKRIATTYAQKRKAFADYSRSQTTDRTKTGKREAPVSRRSDRALRQLTFCALILVGVVALKLLAPQTLEPVRTQLLHLMGDETDFVSVFSDLGRAVGSGEGIGEALADACAEVFGSSEVAAVDTASVPDDACMVQQVLGFTYAAPLNGAVNDRFGYREHPTEGEEKFHYGLDLQGASGDVIHSFADGTVTAVGESSTLGKYVTVLHKNGYTTLYAHCSRITASSGQQVKLGDPIAEVGKSGQATGPHLHFELYRDTLYFNPIYYVEQ